MLGGDLLDRWDLPAPGINPEAYLTSVLPWLNPATNNTPTALRPPDCAQECPLDGCCSADAHGGRTVTFALTERAMKQRACASS